MTRPSPVAVLATVAAALIAAGSFIAGCALGTEVRALLRDLPRRWL